MWSEDGCGRIIQMIALIFLSLFLIFAILTMFVSWRISDKAENFTIIMSILFALMTFITTIIYCIILYCMKE